MFLNIIRTVAPFVVKTGKNILNGLLGGNLTGYNLNPMEGTSAEAFVTTSEATVRIISKNIDIS